MTFTIQTSKKILNKKLSALYDYIINMIVTTEYILLKDTHGCEKITCTDINDIKPNHIYLSSLKIDRRELKRKIIGMSEDIIYIMVKPDKHQLYLSNKDMTEISIYQGFVLPYK